MKPYIGLCTFTSYN